MVKGDYNHRSQGQFIDSWGTPVFTSRRVIKMGDRPAGLLIKIDVAEAFAGSMALRGSLAWFIALIIIGGVVATSAVARSFTRPIRSLVGMMEGLAEGNLTQMVEIVRGDEFGRMMASSSRMIQNLRDLVTGIRENVAATSDAAQEMAATTEELSASIEQVASTTNEFADAVRRVSKGAQVAAKDAEGVKEESARGAAQIAAAIGTIKDIGDVVEDLSGGSSIGALPGIGQMLALIIISPIRQTSRSMQPLKRPGPANTPGLCRGGRGSAQTSGRVGQGRAGVRGDCPHHPVQYRRGCRRS